MFNTTLVRIAILANSILLGPAYCLVLLLGHPLLATVLFACHFLLSMRLKSSPGFSQQFLPLACLHTTLWGLSCSIIIWRSHFPENILFFYALVVTLCLYAYYTIRYWRIDLEHEKWFRIYTPAFSLLILAISLAALLARLYFIENSLMTFVFMDELKTIGNAYDMMMTGELLPKVSVYKGGVNHYPLIAVFYVAQRILQWIGYVNDYTPHPKWFFFDIGRIYYALIASAAIPLIYAVGRALYSKWAGLIACILLAFSADHIFFSYFPKEDHLVLLFVLFTILFSIRYAYTACRSYLWLAGITTGLAIGSKVSSAILLVVPLIAILTTANHHSKPGQITLRKALSRGVLIAGECGLAVLVFLLFNPSYYLDIETVKKNYLFMLKYMNVPMFGVTLAEPPPNSPVGVWPTFISLLQSTTRVTGHPVIDWICLAGGIMAMIRKHLFGLSLPIFNLLFLAILSFYSYAGYRFQLPIIVCNSILFGCALPLFIEKHLTSYKIIHYLQAALVIFFICFFLGPVFRSNLDRFNSRIFTFKSFAKTTDWLNENIPFGSKILSNHFLAVYLNPNAYNVKSIWFLGYSMDIPITTNVVNQIEFVAVSERDMIEAYEKKRSVYDYVFTNFSKVGETTVVSLQESDAKQTIYRNPKIASVADLPPYASFRSLQASYSDAILTTNFSIFRNNTNVVSDVINSVSTNRITMGFSKEFRASEKARLIPDLLPYFYLSFVTRDNHYDLMLKTNDVVSAVIVIPYDLLQSRPILNFKYQIADPTIADYLDLVIDGESAEGVNVGRILLNGYAASGRQSLQAPVQKIPASSKGDVTLNLREQLQMKCLRPDAIQFVKLVFHASRPVSPLSEKEGVFCRIENLRLSSCPSDKNENRQ